MKQFAALVPGFRWVLVASAYALVVGSSTSCTRCADGDQHADDNVHPSAPHPSAEQMKGPRRALLVGINDYRYDDISDLNGTANDVAAMRDVLVRRYGFLEKDIVVLQDKAATKQAILNTFRSHLVEGADKETVAVFFYSGHGSQMYDESGDEPDERDETLVAHDSGRSGDHENRDVVDDELNELLAELGKKTPYTTVILDSCHSGSAVRAAGKIRSIAPDDRRRPKDAAATGTAAARATAEAHAKGTDGVGEGALSYTLISGARTDEYSFERSIAGRTMGALTWTMTRALWKTEPTDTYRDLVAQVSAEVNRNFPTQHPQIEGSQLDAVLFGRQTMKPEPFLLIHEVKGNWELAGGLVNEVTRGSEFEVFAPGTKAFVPGQGIATVRVTDVQPTTAQVQILSGKDKLTEAARAIETKHEHDRVALRVLLAQPSLPVMSQLRQQLMNFPNIQVLTSGIDYDVEVTEDEQTKQLVLQGTTQNRLSDPVATGPAAVDKLSQQILAWAKWHAFLNLSNEVPFGTKPLEIDFSTSSPQQRVESGSTVDVKVKNRSDRQLYLSLFDLSDDGSLSLVYPAPGANEFIPAGGTWSKPLIPCVHAGAPGDVHDVLKVVLTEAPHDLSFLTQPPTLTGATKSLPHPVEALFAEVAQGMASRGVSRPSAPATSSWATRELPLTIYGELRCPSEN